MGLLEPHQVHNARAWGGSFAVGACLHQAWLSQKLMDAIDATQEKTFEKTNFDFAKRNVDFDLKMFFRYI